MASVSVMEGILMSTGVVITDHGSRIGGEQSVAGAGGGGVCGAVSGAVCDRGGSAHGDGDAFDCGGVTEVRGSVEARHVVVVPYFLGRGKHWSEDIPLLTATGGGEASGDDVSRDGLPGI